MSWYKSLINVKYYSLFSVTYTYFPADLAVTLPRLFLNVAEQPFFLLNDFFIL